MTAKTILQHSFRIAKKDLTELFRNRLGLVLLIVMPLFMMVMVGFIYPSNGTITDLQVGLVNEDSGFNGVFMSNTTHGGFIPSLEAINNQTHMLIITNVSSTADLKDMVQRGDLEGGIVIPSNFSPKHANWATRHPNNSHRRIQPPDIRDNPSRINRRIQCNGSTDSHAQRSAIEFDSTNPLAVVQPFNVQTQGVISGHPSYFDFIAPGIMAMTVMMSVMTGLPVAISQEKEIGTMDGMMVAPVNRLSILLGKTVSSNGQRLNPRSHNLGVSHRHIRSRHTRQHPARVCAAVAGCV